MQARCKGNVDECDGWAERILRARATGASVSARGELR